jgi:hypothetical protein
MSALSSTIREKPEWWAKMKDPGITPRWRAEVLEQQEQEDTPLNKKMDEQMVGCISIICLTDGNCRSDRLCFGGAGRLCGPQRPGYRHTGQHFLFLIRVC